MRITIFLISVLWCFHLEAQTVSVIDLEDYNSMINSQNDDLMIVNFWATWCGPCLKEIPHFGRFAKTYPNTDVILISVDFEKQASKVMSVLKRLGYTGDTYLLSLSDEEFDQIKPGWTGALPLTIVKDPASSSERVLEKEITYSELTLLVTEKTK